LPDAPQTGPSIWKRLLLGAFLLIAASASATAVAAFREVDRVVNALKTNEELELGTELAEADAGKPQTIMLLGSDKRPKAYRARDPLAGTESRSDTIMLVRLDASKNATALMSLPRDLKVNIPGHGIDKINAAYTIGGPKLTLRTVKELTGLRINHVINVDFEGFKEAVNAIGCVYVDIDRRYFNDSSSGQNYATIDVKPGYQRLCGQSALDYVRFRHEDNDLVRSARQQQFLGQAKQQVGVSKLISDRDRLVKIFGKYTRSDIRSRRAVLRLLKLAVASAGHPIREVHFAGRVNITAGDEKKGVPSYVEASDATVKKLTQQFLDVEATKGPRGELKPKGRKRRRRKPQRDLGLENAPDAGREQAVAAVGAGARFRVYYPRMRTRRALFAGDPRIYGIRASNGRVHNAYRMVIKRGLIGEYYGVQGTTWKNPPILDDPSETRRIQGRKYELHYDGDRLRLVAWRTPKAVYWVSNTLLQTLSEKQMLAIARSCRAL
jgi:polyisoprenyl-teichoic acid--peptidoglycan teichoic acid transferase